MITVAEILVVVEDLIFLSKISGTARLVGVAVESVDLRSLEQRVAESPPRAVILDLNHRSGSAVDALRALKSNPATSGVPVVAFLSHVQTDLAAAARAAAADRKSTRLNSSHRCNSYAVFCMKKKTNNISSTKQTGPGTQT